MIRVIRAFTAFAVVAWTAPAAAEPLIFYNGRLFASARINGVRTEALIDSAAEATLVDPELAAKARLGAGAAQEIRGSGGKAPARIVSGVTVEAVGQTLRPEAVVVLNLSELSQRLIRRPTNAIIGRELFDAARIRIDIRGREISAADRMDTPPGKALKLTKHAGIESMPASVNGLAAQAEFDLGNGSEVMISRALVRKLKLRPIGRKAGGGIGGAVQRDLVRLVKLEVGGATFRNVLAAVDDQPNANDLNIGTSLLQNFLITADFAERTVWLQPVGRIGR